MTGAEKKELLDLIQELNGDIQVHMGAPQLNVDCAILRLHSFRCDTRDKLKEALAEAIEEL